VNKSIAQFCVVLSTLAVSGCQIDSTDKTTEDIIVADQLSGTARYNIDLTRDDAVFLVAPNLDVSRLSVTCPTLLTIPFTTYINTRIRPTGSTYDPAKEGLRLANAAVPREVLSRPTNAYLVDCQWVDVCTDNADGFESCWRVCE
jgi:hypothetical protein